MHARPLYAHVTLFLLTSVGTKERKNALGCLSKASLPEEGCLIVQDLQLKDYAVIEGFVQLPHKGSPKREVPEELEYYQPPDVNAMAHRLRKNDNSDLIPPWEPPDDAEEEEARKEMETCARLFQDDPDFKDMGPYTNPQLAEEYHSHDVELRHLEPRGQLSVPIFNL